RVGVLDVRLELQRDIQRSRAILEDRNQTPAANPAEAVAGRPRDGAAIEDSDVVPVHERPLDRAGTFGIARLEVGERLVRQHHPPAKRVRSAVALDDQDLVGRISTLHRDGEVEPAWPSTETCNAHSNAQRTTLNEP